MLSKKKKIAIAIGLITVFSISGYGGYSYYQNQQVVKEQANTETVTVQKTNIRSTVSATGTIRPVNSVEISSKITARLKTVNVKENEKVKSGQILATLDAKDYEAKRDQAQFKVTNTKAKYDRALYLFKTGAYSEEQLEDATLNYHTALSELDRTNNDVGETDIISPIDGIVVGEPKSTGTMAVAGSDNPTVIMRVADMSTKEIQAKVDETDIGNIKVGQKATFTVDAYNGKTFTATVSLISQTDTGNSWDTSSSKTTSTSNSVIYYYVTLAVEDPDNILLPAMTARVNINTAEKEDTLVVPISTLKTDSSGTYVMVKNGDQQEKRQVETGIYSDDMVEIISGLNEGEEVVSSYKASETKKNDKDQGRPPR